MVRGLLDQVRSDAPPGDVRNVDGEAHETLLDLKIDGVRCLLLRFVPRASKSEVMLSPREREISRMVAKGYPNKTIAAVLDISTWTVCTYLRRIFAKLGVGTRAAMVARLLEKGLLSLLFHRSPISDEYAEALDWELILGLVGLVIGPIGG
jgi:DNA-binding CsgD family transcriptional regulator